ncbi:MAG: DUF948 domain-containing protein [Pseudonocardiales bacterium]|nr:MAG: DUF948 domain-containing protein [Pseudonocardiales bacterium]
MSGPAIAGLVASGGFAVLVLVLAVPILKLGRTIDETTKLVASLNERTAPLITDLDTTLRQVGAQLERVDAITTNAQTVTTNIASLTSLFAATLGSPVVKVAAFTYGVRKAVTGRRKADASKRVAQEIKDERRRGRHEKGRR